MTPEIQNAVVALHRLLQASHEYDAANNAAHEAASKIPPQHYDLYIAYCELTQAQDAMELAKAAGDEAAVVSVESTIVRIRKGIAKLEEYRAEQDTKKAQA